MAPSPAVTELVEKRQGSSPDDATNEHNDEVHLPAEMAEPPNAGLKFGGRLPPLPEVSEKSQEYPELGHESSALLEGLKRL